LAHFFGIFGGVLVGHSSPPKIRPARTAHSAIFSPVERPPVPWPSYHVFSWTANAELALAGDDGCKRHEIAAAFDIFARNLTAE